MKYLLSICLSLLMTCAVQAQEDVNWTPEQLLQPAELAAHLDSATNRPVIICVGPGASIPHSVAVGAVNSPEGLAKLKTELQALPRDKKVVVYCGCCPFDHCPNARPAVAMLTGMKFTNFYLLNLPHNLKTDWIDKGFPTVTLSN